MASQAQQSWYVQDPVDPNWHVALKMTPRDLFNVDPEVNVTEDFEDYYVDQRQNNEEGDIDDMPWVREDIEGLIINASTTMVRENIHPTGEIDITDPNDEVSTSDEDDEIEESNSDSSAGANDDDDFFEEFGTSNEDDI